MAAPGARAHALPQGAFWAADGTCGQPCLHAGNGAGGRPRLPAPSVETRLLCFISARAELGDRWDCPGAAWLPVVPDPS